jgi:hypothetical protein
METVNRHKIRGLTLNLNSLYHSVSCRFYVAKDAEFAMHAPGTLPGIARWPASVYGQVANRAKTDPADVCSVISPEADSGPISPWS